MDKDLSNQDLDGQAVVDESVAVTAETEESITGSTEAEESVSGLTESEESVTEMTGPEESVEKIELTNPGPLKKLLDNKIFDLGNIIFIIILLGILLRISYFAVTDFTVRQHDVIYADGHLDYIKYILNKLSLPDSGAGQYYQPPLQYILSAVIFAFGKAIGLSEFLSGRLLQLVMILFSTLSMILVYKMLKMIKLKRSFIIAGTALFAFHPTNVLLSVQINNDNLMLFFYILTFYLLIRWLNDKSYKSIILMALSMSAAILTKKSAVMLAVPIGAAFIAELIKNRHSIMKCLRQYYVFIVIALPLSLLHIIRNYILFGQGIGFIPEGGGSPRALPNTLAEFAGFPVKNLFKNLFVDPFNGAPFFEYSFKTSLFGEWSFDYIKGICSILILAGIVIMLLVFIQMVSQNKNDFSKYGYLFLLNIIVPIALNILMRAKLPAGYSQDFRYISPILISGAFFIGCLINRLQVSRNKILIGIKYITIAFVFLFCASSAVFILSIR